MFALILFIWCFSFTKANANSSSAVGVPFEVVDRDSPRYDLMPHRSSARRLDSTSSFSSIIMSNPSFKNYIMQIYLGTPRASLWLVIYTALDFLTEIHCGPSCLKCIIPSYLQSYFAQVEPYFDYSASHTFRAIHCHTPECDKHGGLGCDHTYGVYCEADGFDIPNPEIVFTDAVSFSPSDPTISPQNYCYFKSFTPFLDKPYYTYNASGLISLGNHSISFINQLNITTFSYCLPPMSSTKYGSIHFGLAADEIFGNVIWTPLTTKITNGNHMYYVALLNFNIGLGNDKVNFSNTAQNNDGNMVMDTATYLTLLPQGTLDGIVVSLQKYIACPRAPYVEISNGLKLCYNVSNCPFVLPPIVANFIEGSLCLPQSNTFVEVQDGVQCLAVSETTSYAVWGSAFQAGFMIAYDLVNHLVKFQSGAC